jgi:hypothetical protein
MRQQIINAEKIFETSSSDVMEIVNACRSMSSRKATEFEILEFPPSAVMLH